MKHARFSPSKMSRVIACPGSITLCDTVPKPPASSYAQHGTDLHAVIEQGVIKDTLEVDEYLALPPQDKVLIEDAWEYYKGVLASFENHPYVVTTELKVNLSGYGFTNMWGYLDVKISCPDLRELHIMDWKFGQGVFVSVHENTQQKIYGSGAILADRVIYDKVVLHIVQPALQNYGVFETTPDKLKTWMMSEVKTAVNDAESSNPTFNPGEEQCRWCEASAVCPAKMEQLLGDIDFIMGTSDNMKHVSIEQVCEALELGPRVDAAIKALKAHVQSQAMSGLPTPGFKLVTGRSSRKWINEEKTIDFLIDKLDPEAIFVSKLVSPAQAEQRDKKLKQDPAFLDLYLKTEGKLTIAPLSDRRPEAKPEQEAKNLFDMIG